MSAGHHVELVVKGSVVEVAGAHLHAAALVLQCRVAVVAGQVVGKVGHHLLHVAAAEAALHTVHSVGRHHDVGHTGGHQVAFKVGFYLHNHVGAAGIHVVHAFLVGLWRADEGEKRRCRELVGEPTGERRVVVVHHGERQILYLLGGSTRHYVDHSKGKNHEHDGQNDVSYHLLELFFYEIAKYHETILL